MVSRLRDLVAGLSKHVSTDLSVALNYGQAMGSGQLLRFTTEHTEASLS